MNLLAISGKSGSGKDTIADYLVAEYGYIKVALADPLKRFVRTVYDFSEAQLWGPSALRNAPDIRYLRKTFPRHCWVERASSTQEDNEWVCEQCEFREKDLRTSARSKLGDECLVYLSPRYALQQLGTNWGRECYSDTWVNLGLSTARQLLDRSQSMTYTGPKGLLYAGESSERPTGVVVTDCRFTNEVTAFQAAGGRVFRVERAGTLLQGNAAAHASETELDGLSPSSFDAHIQNDSTLDNLFKCANDLVQPTVVSSR